MVVYFPMSAKLSPEKLICKMTSKRVNSTATARLKQDYIRLKKDPVPYVSAEPHASNILEWHYMVKGPENSPYEGGYYHGKLIFPREYPFKPPSIYMITPNGRFKCNTRLCLSISDFHPDTWNPAWSVSTILTGLLSFMLENSPTLGSIEKSDYAKRQYAAQSGEFNLKDKTFTELFPDIVEEINQVLKKRQQQLEERTKKDPNRMSNIQRTIDDQGVLYNCEMDALNNILSDLQWDEGIAMPVSNIDNKLLEDEIQRKQKKIAALNSKKEENVDRISNLREHMKNVKQELNHTQSLVNFQRKAVETTDHLGKVANREGGRIKHELARLGKDLNEVKERSNRLENEVFQRTKKLDDVKESVNVDEKALEEWLEESSKRDEDAMALLKYNIKDEGRIKTMNLQLERLCDIAKKKKEELEKETTETLTTQIELDKTAEEFRKIHLERQDLLFQWEKIIKQMQVKDDEITQMAVKLTLAKQDIRTIDEEIAEKEQFLKAESDNNDEIRKQTIENERILGKLKIQYQEEELVRDQFNSELEALQRTCERTALDLESMRCQVTQLKKESNEKSNQLRDIQEKKKDLVEKFKVANEISLSAEERAQEMDKLLIMEEKLQTRLSIELDRLREQNFRNTEIYTKLKSEKKNIESEIQGIYTTIRHLNTKLTKLDTEGLKQQEILYNQDFTIQQLERRMGRMHGETSNEDKLRMEEKIKVLLEELKEKENKKSIMIQQLKRSQDDVRRIKRNSEKAKSEMDHLVSKIEEVDLHAETAERELKKTINKKQDLMVEENVLKVELKKVRNILGDKADDVVSLKKRKLQLDIALKERSREISLYKDMMINEMRLVEDERQNVSSELHERVAKIDKLKKRYELLMVTMGSPEGEEEQSQAFYVIKSAQEKEELQKDGDELDAKIRKAEKEMGALENTLRVINSRNEIYRKSFNKVQETSDEMEEKQELEEQYRAAQDKFKYKKRLIRELTHDLKLMGNTIEELSIEGNHLSEMYEQNKKKMSQLNKEIYNQNESLDRVQRQTRNLNKVLKKGAKRSTEETDIELRGAREFNKSVMREINEVITQFPNMSNSAHAYFLSANLPPPSMTSTPASSVRGSVHSSGSTSSSRSSLSLRL
ncbi:DgyrCDS295 [Dimorphilus gyrociliatus]|uniref:Coiled-coil domain-containing protein 39 n=1 Tax=Dimorphilus gyrociliatus TaxID=2664684 RepID=A0A7I8V5D6_9ANNE|nr:DgyrCDS295 [Dimorphilus gyrociliatus]